LRGEFVDHEPHDFDARQAGGQSLDEIADDLIPEDGEGFVIARVGRVLAALTQVVERDVGAEALQRVFMVQNVAGGEHQMMRVLPV